MKRLLVLTALLLGFAFPGHAEIVTREVEYRSDGTPLRGYLAYDDTIRGKRPGVLVVHEWWGLNDYARKRARMVAELGYTAFAIDMYGHGKTASHPDTAGKFAGEFRDNLPLAKKRFIAGLDVLKSQPTVDPTKIAAIGYCFGGGVVLSMARAGVDIDGVASFHGSLPTDHPPRPGEVKAAVLVLNGAADPFITEKQIALFNRQMKEAKADYTFIGYPGAKHSFTNPEADELGRKFDLPLAYDAEADRASWQALQDFLGRIFKN